MGLLAHQVFSDEMEKIWRRFEKVVVVVVEIGCWNAVVGELERRVGSVGWRISSFFDGCC